MSNELKVKVESEQNLLSILLNKPEIIDKLNMRGEYFGVNDYKVIFEKLSEYRTITHPNFIRELGNERANIAINLMVNNVHGEDAMSNMAIIYARYILEAYKEREKFRLDSDYSNGSIDYSEYFYQLGQLEKLSVIVTESATSEDELMELISQENKGLEIPRFPRLTKLLNISMTDIITFSARSGYGKSAMLLNIFQAMSQSDEYKCHYFNMEVSPSVMSKRLVAITSDVAIDRLHELKDSATIKNAVHKITNSDSYIHSSSMTIEELKAIVMQSYDESKLNVVFVDHVGLLQTTNKNIKSEYDRITYVMLQLRAFAMDNNLLVFQASQFDRSSIKSGNVGMHSMKGSGEVENSSTHVIIMEDSDVYKPSPKDDEVEKERVQKLYDMIADRQWIKLRLEKNRNGLIGEIENYDFVKCKQLMKESE